MDYVADNLTSSKVKTFYAAQDAEAVPKNGGEKREGAWLVWSFSELERLFPNDDQLLILVFCAAFGVRREGGNVDSALDPQGHLKGQNVLYREKSDAELAREFAPLTRQKISEFIARGRVLLQQERATRPKPIRDDKFVTAWNGYMISGLCSCYQSFKGEKYLQMAQAAAEFYLPKLPNLQRAYWEDENEAEGLPATCIDWAALVKAFLDLYECSLDSRWKFAALSFQKELNSQLADYDSLSGKFRGGYFSAKAKLLLVRMKDDQDNVEPSGNSVTLGNLLRLSQLDFSHHPNADQEMEEFVGGLAQMYQQQLFFVNENMPLGLSIAQSAEKRILIQLCAPAPADLADWLHVIHQNRPSEFHVGIDYQPLDKVQAHICQHNTCGPPLASINELLAELKKNKKI